MESKVIKAALTNKDSLELNELCTRMNYNRFFNQISLRRSSSLLRDMPPMLAARPNCLNFAGGLPDPDTFPISRAIFYLRDGSELHLDEETMEVALQYNHSEGVPLLRDWLYELQIKVHDPPTMRNGSHPAQTTCIVTSGGLEGLSKTVEAFVSEGDNVLIENPTYTGVLSALRPLGCKILPVQTDAMGIDPENLQQILSKWTPEDAKDPKSGIPKVLYCVPSGGNPTGAGLTLERKKEIYRLAQKYDFIILEDDPYFFLQFSQSLVPSFLSLDTDGRVVRFDSLSKVFSAGIRVGLTTAPLPIIQKITYHMMCSTAHASGISQMVLKFLQELGHDGFLAHVEKIRDHYREKSIKCIEALEKHLSGLAEWTIPSGGMFIWLKLLNLTDTYDLVMNTVYQKDVLFAPGRPFCVENSAPCPYIRVSFSKATPEQMDLAFSTLAEVLREKADKKE